MKIELVPGTLGNTSVIERLKLTIKKSESIRGCVAYWLINPSVLGADFTSLIGNINSFYCVDINKPTDLDMLDRHYQEGATNLFLYLYQARSKKYPWLRHLLHAKIMLFDLPYGKAEIWVGSHNLTKRAMIGRNLEASTVITCERESDYYKAVNAYLLDIRNTCEAYDQNLLNYYKALQNDKPEIEEEGQNVNIIQLVGKDITGVENEIILLLGDDENDLNNLSLGKVNNSLYVNIMDLKGEHREVIYKASVRNTGIIIPSDRQSYGVQFTNRFSAIRRWPFIPYQSKRKREFGFNDLKNFRYWANIIIEEEMVGARLVPIKRSLGQKLWHKVGDDKTISDSLNRDEFSRIQESEDDLRDISEDAVYYSARPQEQIINQTFKYRLESGSSLKDSLTRTDSAKVLEFFEIHFELPYFENLEQQLLTELHLPKKGSNVFNLLKEFQSNTLIKQMRLIMPKK